MSGWWVHEFWNSGQRIELIAWIFWVIAAITLHELAHGWAALWEGDDTPSVTGHMTANPVVHMGVPSIIAFLIIGIAWGMMPVNPYRFRHGKWGRILVSFAGPAMNLLLAGCTLIALGVIMKPDVLLEHGFSDVERFLFTGGFLNLILFALNMLPVPPLDGSNILANLSSTVANWYRHPRAQMAGLLLFFALMWSGLFGAIFNFAERVSLFIAYSIANGLQ
jgi:Zn-dependent protease